MVSKRISVFPEFSCQHRVTAAVTQTNLYLHTQPLAFTCWWSPLLCTWLKTLACWHGARFSGETGGGSVAAFSLQPAATWWCTGTNSSEAACALQTSPPSATRLISYITKVGGKWKKKKKPSGAGNDSVVCFAHISHPTCHFLLLWLCSGFICCWEQLHSTESAFPPLSGCLCYFDGNMFNCVWPRYAWTWVFP